MTIQDEPKELESPEVLELEGLPLGECVARLADLSARVAQGASDAGVRSLVVRLAFKESGPEMRKAWVDYFAASKDQLFLPLLEEWLGDPDEELRLGVVSSIAWNRGAGTNDSLLRTIEQDPSQRVRRIALKYLVRRGSLGGWDPCDLTEIVREEDWRPVTKREYMKLVGGSFEV